MTESTKATTTDAGDPVPPKEGISDLRAIAEDVDVIVPEGGLSKCLRINLCIGSRSSEPG